MRLASDAAPIKALHSNRLHTEGRGLRAAPAFGELRVTCDESLRR